MPDWRQIDAILKLPGLPKRRTLYDWAKKRPRLPFIRKRAKVYQVDLEHPEWLKRLAKYQSTTKISGTRSTPPGKMKKALSGNSKPTKPVDAKKTAARSRKKRSSAGVKLDVYDCLAKLDDAIDRTTEASDLVVLIKERMTLEKLAEDIISKRTSNQQAKRKLHKEDFTLIEWQLAMYLFFGYFEKFNNELLKLSDKLETPVRNMTAEGDADGILKRYQREHESLLKEVKKSQALDLKNWKKENGVDS